MCNTPNIKLGNLLIELSCWNTETINLQEVKMTKQCFGLLADKLTTKKHFF